MSTWRFIAATTALCLFAQSASAASEHTNSRGEIAQKKHTVARHARPQKYATHRKSRRYASHQKLRRAATRIVRSRPAPVAAHDFSGMASYYWEGSRVASGGRYNPDGLTAAHRTLPFGTRLRVTDLVSSRSVVVVVNDRGPFIPGRVLDLSRGAAVALGMTARGVTPIKATVM
jgi:rare lipoprotein A